MDKKVSISNPKNPLRFFSSEIIEWHNEPHFWVCTALIKARRTNTQCAGRQVESHYNLTHTAAASLRCFGMWCTAADEERMNTKKNWSIHGCCRRSTMEENVSKSNLNWWNKSNTVLLLFHRGEKRVVSRCSRAKVSAHTTLLATMCLDKIYIYMRCAALLGRPRCKVTLPPPPCDN